MRTLPEATTRPCRECPWRREAAPGWLGPYDASEWIELAHSDAPIACHRTVEVDDEWDGHVRQCAGAATYRRNICKRPRDPEVAVADQPDTESIFGLPHEFMEHHERNIA